MSKIRLHGSSSGYTEITPVAASGNNTITLPNDGTIISKDSAGAIGVTSVHTTKITNTGQTVISNDILSADDDFFVYSYKGGSSGQVRSGIQFDSSNQRMEFYTGTNERMRIETNGDLKFDSGYGSAATAYGVRAWMQYRGDTNAIIGSANVSSVTDNATGDFTMNFTTAMPDTNYAVLGTTGYNDTSLNIGLTASGTHAAFTTSAMRFTVNVNYNSSYADERYISVAIVR